MGDVVARLNLLIRQSQQGPARDELLKTNFKKVPREQVAAFADLARRLNMPKIMLSLLKPIVRKEIPSAPPPTPLESALYATALSRLGVFTEAQNILKKIDPVDTPEVLLFSAQNFMLQWDYLGAIPKLKKYVARAEITPYARLVGKVNLASSLIGEMLWNEAEVLLSELVCELDEAARFSTEEADAFSLLQANALGLMTHAAFLREDIRTAEKCVAESARLLAGSKSRYELLAKKWQAILNLFARPDDADQLGEFRKLKAEAVSARDWETARDFEFFEALSLRDDELFLRLYHGTPYTSYRKRIKKIYQPKIVIPKMVEWKWNGSNSVNENGPVRVFDLSKGCEVGGRANLTTQPMLYRLLQFLTKDFYRPVALGSVFSALYPKEKFNQETSPNRTYLVAKRLRKWFEVNDIPLDIEVENEWFRLRALRPYAIRISFQNFNISRNDAIFESVQKVFGVRKFAVEELATELDLTVSQSKKFLTWALKRRKIRRFRAGKTSLFVLL